MGRVETSVHGRVGTSSLLFKFHWGNMKQFLIWPCVCVRVQFSILVCLNGLIYCVQLSYMQHCDRKQIRVVRSIPLIFLCEKFFAWLNNSSSSILMNDVFWRVSFLRDYLFLFISIIPFCFLF